MRIATHTVGGIHWDSEKSFQLKENCRVVLLKGWPSDQQHEHQRKFYWIRSSGGEASRTVLRCETDYSKVILMTTNSVWIMKSCQAALHNSCAIKGKISGMSSILTWTGSRYTFWAQRICPGPQCKCKGNTHLSKSIQLCNWGAST